jgi:hypothetical protein
MLTRRIVISACALCLAVPAAAGASPATDPPKPTGPYGITSPDPPKFEEARGPYGTTTPDPPKFTEATGPYGTTTPDPPTFTKARGPYGITTAGPQNIVKAKGPYGITVATGPQHTTAATVHAAGASGQDATNDWRAAAVSEGALLAALAAGSGVLLLARRRTVRLGI